MADEAPAARVHYNSACPVCNAGIKVQRERMSLPAKSSVSQAMTLSHRLSVSPYPVARAALAYSRSIEGRQTGQVYKVF